MPFLLGDIFIGDFPVTQVFGARPEVYSARFGIKGHNGVDWGCPSLTMIISAADGIVQTVGTGAKFDTGGYGNYIKILHNGYLTLYGHLNDVVVKEGDHVVCGQLIAHSNNTGLSDAPHLHFGVAPADTLGNKTEANNGYSGYIDPMDETLCKWDVKNLAAPVTPTSVEDQKIAVPSTDFTTMVTEATNAKVIKSYLLKNGLNTYLSNHTIPPVNIDHPDPLDGEHIVTYLTELIAELKMLNEAHKRSVQLPTDSQTLQEVEQTVAGLPQDKKNGFFTNLLSSIKNFIIVSKS